MFFDSHCHLTDATLATNSHAVLERAASAAVSGMLSIAVDLADTKKILEMADGEQIWATAGVHPQQALSWGQSHSEQLRKLSTHPHVCAIGELGLDYLYDDAHPEHPGATRQFQEQVMEAQLQIAAEENLPVVIHNRLADDRLLEIVTAWAPRLPAGGVFHCFGSGAQVARRVLDLGFYLGITGIVTFKNAAEVREVVALCPLERLLIETDAPYLAPVPHRGKPNEPAYVPLVAAKIAEVKGMAVAEVGLVTTANARRLFHLGTQ